MVVHKEQGANGGGGQQPTYNHKSLYLGRATPITSLATSPPPPLLFISCVPALHLHPCLHRHHKHIYFGRGAPPASRHSQNSLLCPPPRSTAPDPQSLGSGWVRCWAAGETLVGFWLWKGWFTCVLFLSVAVAASTIAICIPVHREAPRLLGFAPLDHG